MGFDVLALVKVSVVVLWATPLCRLLSGYMCCGGNYRFILKLNLWRRGTKDTREICSSFSLFQTPLKFLSYYVTNLISSNGSEKHLIS